MAIQMQRCLTFTGCMAFVYSTRHKVYAVAMLLTAARCIHLIDIVKDSMQGDLRCNQPPGQDVCILQSGQQLLGVYIKILSVRLLLLVIPECSKLCLTCCCVFCVIHQAQSLSQPCAVDLIDHAKQAALVGQT